MCKLKLQETRENSIKKLIEENAFEEVYSFVKRKIMYLHVAIDNYNLIFASKYENYYSFARISPAFINMVEQSVICGIYTNIAELIQRDTIVGLHTLTKIALQNNENDIDIKEKSKNILAFLKENRKMLSELIRFRNKEICHFDENVLTHNAVAQNAQCLNIKVLKQFLTRIEELVSQLRLACTKDGIYETMCPINSSDSNSIKDILNTFIEFKSEIIELKYQKKKASCDIIS